MFVKVIEKCTIFSKSLQDGASLSAVVKLAKVSFRNCINVILPTFTRRLPQIS